LTEVSSLQLDDHAAKLADWDTWVHAQRQDLDLVALDAAAPFERAGRAAAGGTATPRHAERPSSARAPLRVGAHGPPDVASTWKPPTSGTAPAAPPLAPLPAQPLTLRLGVTVRGPASPRHLAPESLIANSIKPS
jgi:hypothetical protein